VKLPLQSIDLPAMCTHTQQPITSQFAGHVIICVH